MFWKVTLFEGLRVHLSHNNNFNYNSSCDNSVYALLWPQFLCWRFSSYSLVCLDWNVFHSIAIYSPIYYVAKRKYPLKTKAFLRVHVFGNLFSFMLITVHFAQQISRPAAFFPDLSTGLVLYIVMPILVATGYLYRFRVFKSIKPHVNRFLHVSLTITFYITIIVHILQGLSII